MECCALKGTFPYDEPITRPEESCRLWCVIVFELDTSRMWRPWLAMGCAPEKRIYSWIIDTVMMGPTSRPVTLVNNQTTPRQHQKIQHNSEYKTPKTHFL